MIKVLIVDDSAVVRKVLTESLSKFRDIEIIGTAVDPYVARDKILRLKPDVITLDLEMPRMHGLAFLSKLMKYKPMPVVIVSSIAQENSQIAIKALQAGAVEVICKPGSPHDAGTIGHRVAFAIRSAAKARVSKQVSRRKRDSEERDAGSAIIISVKPPGSLIAIGASTGGTAAIEFLLRRLPADTPGMVIVQHMPEYFTKAFADRLNSVVPMNVREARDNDLVEDGLALIAPGDFHMMVSRAGKLFHVHTKKGPAVHHQRPSVDVLFASVAKYAGENTTAVLLTGMGSDGANGLKEIRKNGGYTIAQNEESCVVFGMPREAVRMDAVDDVVALESIADRILLRYAGEPVER